MLSTAIDIALVLLIAFCVWRGSRNGFFRGLFGILAILIAIYGANLAAKTFSGEFTGMLEPFISGIVDSAVVDVLEKDETPQETGDAALSDEEKANVFDVSFAALRNVGIAKEASKLISEKVSGEMNVVGQQMATNLTAKLCQALAYIAVFGISFILIAIIFAVLGNIINLAFSLPGMELLDRIIGLVFGLFRGLLIVFALAVVIRYLGLLSAETVEKTTLLKYIINVNPLAEILGI